MACLSPYKVPQNNEGRFLQWNPITYLLENQTEPIELCEPSTNPCNYEFPDLTDIYALPIQPDDVVKWIMNKNEITIDAGSDITSIKIGLVQEGVLVASDIGTIAEYGSQYFCTATIPSCLDEACDYQFVIYDSSIMPNVTCGLYAGSTLQNIIDDNLILGQVLECTLNNFL